MAIQMLTTEVAKCLKENPHHFSNLKNKSRGFGATRVMGARGGNSEEAGTREGAPGLSRWHPSQGRGRRAQGSRAKGTELSEGCSLFKRRRFRFESNQVNSLLLKKEDKHSSEKCSRIQTTLTVSRMQPHVMRTEEARKCDQCFRGKVIDGDQFQSDLNCWNNQTGT